MFAGPNGSGKSVLKSYLPDPLLGVYLNPDEIEARVNGCGYLDFREFGLGSPDTTEVLRWFTGSEFLLRQGFGEQARRMTLEEGRLIFPPGVMNAYFASVAADLIRRELLERKATFTFETVMSHPGKLELLRKAREAGYRTYLYYVATEDPAINVSRVANRVALGGHPVPGDKIVERYHRSLSLLLDAIRLTNRAYVFDNSTNSASDQHTWVAEITDGRVLDKIS
jgi:predicted ABC-type ATPase